MKKETEVEKMKRLLKNDYIREWKKNHPKTKKQKAAAVKHSKKWTQKNPTYLKEWRAKKK